MFILVFSADIHSPLSLLRVTYVMKTRIVVKVFKFVLNTTQIGTR